MKYILLLLTGTATGTGVYAQGCSDAGVCSLKYAVAGENKNSIAVGNVSGVTDGKTFVNSSYASYARQLTKVFSWDAKLTAVYASGKLANNFNAGDVFTNFLYNPWQDKTKQKSLVVLAGIKIPLNAANDKAGGKPLPMAYQASLGTYDFSSGVNFISGKWEFTHAWQVPLTRENKNTFIEEYSASDDFPSTNRFKRAADALLRVGYHVKTPGKKISFKPAVLAIYHVAKDSYEDIYGKRQLLEGSQGLTLNANIISKYSIGKTASIELSLAAPFAVRQLRPDGLTREFTAGVEYKISF